jgi:hypothetical protein
VVSCLFCNEKFSSSNDLSIHLILCGNKTDACPKCKKYIRRAVFAYHYQNNCTNIDESDRKRDSFVDHESPALNNHQRNRMTHSSSLSSQTGELYLLLPDEHCNMNDSSNFCITSRQQRALFERCCSYSMRILSWKHRCIELVESCCESSLSIVFFNDSISFIYSRRVAKKTRENESTHLLGSIHIFTVLCFSSTIKYAIFRQIEQSPITEMIPCEICQKSFSSDQLHSHQVSITYVSNADLLSRNLRVMRYSLHVQDQDIIDRRVLIITINYD